MSPSCLNFSLPKESSKNVDTTLTEEDVQVQKTSPMLANTNVLYCKADSAALSFLNDLSMEMDQ